MKDYVASALNRAFSHCYHQDVANAQMQLASPKFRPLTIELAQAMRQYKDCPTSDLGVEYQLVLEQESNL